MPAQITLWGIPMQHKSELKVHSNSQVNSGGLAHSKVLAAELA